jgi:hypothetical protein
MILHSWRLCQLPVVRRSFSQIRCSDHRVPPHRIERVAGIECEKNSV